MRFLAHFDVESKREQLLQDHLLNVSQKTKSATNKIGLSNIGAMIGLLHDFGKYSKEFQQYILEKNEEIRKLKKGTIDHSTAGAQAFWNNTCLSTGFCKFVSEIISICIASHHSGLIDCIAPSGKDQFTKRMNKPDNETHYTEAINNIDQCIKDEITYTLDSTQLQNIITDIYKVDSSETIRQFKIGLLLRYMLSCLIDADRTDTVNFSKPYLEKFREQRIQWSVLSDLLENEIKKFTNITPINKLRQQISNSCLSFAAHPKGIYTLTAPTGAAKTIGVFRFGLNHALQWNMDRVIYVAPFTSILDQNSDVIREILEPIDCKPNSRVLEHHSNLTPEKAKIYRNKLLSENWDAPVIMTTGVQLLNCLFESGTQSLRRMHQLANSVLIFDEIQSLPLRCVHMFNNAINFLVEQCGCTVVLMTATQPLLHRVNSTKGAIKLLEGNEIVPNVQALFDEFATLQRNEVVDLRKAGGWTFDDVSNLAVDELARTGSCLIICNTKKEAREIFNICCIRVHSDTLIFHLSTAMCASHRTDILNKIRKCLDQRIKVICVSTQLIEGGVDISFGSGIRALAGIDSIAQSAGRVNRHAIGPLGRVSVVNFAEKLPYQLHEIIQAQEAGQRVLDEKAKDGKLDLSNLNVINSYFEYNFFDRQNEMDYPINKEAVGRNDTLLNILSTNNFAVQAYKKEHQQQSPPICFRQSFKTANEIFHAIPHNTIGVLVPYTTEGQKIIEDLCAAYNNKDLDLIAIWKLLKQAQRYSVNVYPQHFETLQKNGAIFQIEDTEIYFLDGQYYNYEFGLDICKIGLEE